MVAGKWTHDIIGSFVLLLFSFGALPFPLFLTFGSSIGASVKVKLLSAFSMLGGKKRARCKNVLLAKLSN